MLEHIHLKLVQTNKQKKGNHTWKQIYRNIILK